MVFSMLGMRNIGMWPLPPGLQIRTIIEVFQSFWVINSLRDWLKNLRSLALKEGRFGVKYICKFVFFGVDDTVSSSCGVKRVSLSAWSRFAKFISWSLSGCCFCRADLTSSGEMVFYFICFFFAVYYFRLGRSAPYFVLSRAKCATSPCPRVVCTNCRIDLIRLYKVVF